MGMDCCDTAILPLHFAAEEAWMSIKGMELTAYSVLSFLAPASGSSSGLALGRPTKDALTAKLF